jgi:GTP-binding protein
VIVKRAEFEISAVRPAQWPNDGLPEFAFVGRSNVGKSSLLNRLLSRKALARVSQKPGKTQQINFFVVNEAFRFADLPGYGYAAVSKTTRAQFSKMMGEYLTQRTPLKRVLHLIDIRHEPTADDQFMHAELMQLGVPLCVVATKSDKISRGQHRAAVQRIEKILRTPYAVVPVSSQTGAGINDVWTMIEADLETLRQV